MSASCRVCGRQVEVSESGHDELFQRLVDTHRHLADVLRAIADLIEASRAEDNSTDDDDPMLTVPDAAALIRRSPSHVRAKCRSGAIKAMADGRGWRIRRSALAAYERRRTA